MIPTPRSTFAVALALTAALIGIRPSAAASEQRSFLVFRGSVLDSAGHPIREAWVTSVGSRRSGTLVDPTGHFMLPIRCEPLGVIARQPFTLRIQARHKGWNITLPDGSHELGLEIGLSADSAGRARLRVRSTDPVIAERIAAATVVSQGGDITFDLQFVGAAGSQPEAGAPEPLTAIEEVTLVGVMADDVVADAAPAADAEPAAIAEPSATAAEPTAIQPVAPESESDRTETIVAAPDTVAAVETVERSVEESETAAASAARNDSLSSPLVAMSTGHDLAAPARKGGHPVDRDQQVATSMVDPSDIAPSVVTPSAGAVVANTIAAPTVAPAKPPVAPQVAPPTAVRTRRDDTSDTLVAGLEPVVFTAPPVAVAETPAPAREGERPRRQPRITFLPADAAVTATTTTTIISATPPPTVAPSAPPAMPNPGPVPPGYVWVAVPSAAAQSGVLPTMVTASAVPVPAATVATTPTVIAAPTIKTANVEVPDSEPLALIQRSSPAMDTVAADERWTPTSNDREIEEERATVTPMMPADPVPANPIVSYTSAPATLDTAAVVEPVSTPPPAGTSKRKTDRTKPKSGTITATVITGSPVSPVPSTTWLSAPRGAAAPPLDTECRARIQGTVEVESERPLEGRTQVTVYLEDDPLIRETVELAMGSPRGFDLRNVPCGPHRLKFEIRSRYRFVMISEDPRIDCSGGGLRQTRIVLQRLNGRLPTP